jgi:hypothetical protein
MKLERFIVPAMFAALIIVGCGGNMSRPAVVAVSPTPAATPFTCAVSSTSSECITGPEVFNASMTGKMTFQNGYGEPTFIDVENAPPSNFLTAGSVVMHITKTACEAYWAIGTCDAETWFVLSPVSDGSWIAPAALINFPTDIPAWIGGHHQTTQDYVTPKGSPTPYLVVPAGAVAGKTDSRVTSYLRYDGYDELTYDSVISGPAIAQVFWSTDSYIEQVTTPVYSGAALVSDVREGSCGHEKWYFAPGLGLVKVVSLNDGSGCVATDPALSMSRVQ